MYQDVINKEQTTVTLSQKSISGCTATTLFRVKVMFSNADNNLFPKPLECREEILLPVTQEELASKLEEWWDAYMDDDATYPLCFIVQEVPAFTDYRTGAHIREWIYEGGCFTSESLCCHNYGCEKFMGRPTELIRFKEGDLVNIIYDDKLSAGLVLTTPPTDTEVMQRFEEFRNEFTASSSEKADWEAYNAFDSGPSADCYKVMVPRSDHSLVIELVPASRVTNMHLAHHLPHELACILTYKLRESKRW